MDERQKSSPETHEPLHRVPPEAVCHRPPAPSHPTFSPGPVVYCPRAPKPQELYHVSSDDLCHLPAAPICMAPPIEVREIKEATVEFSPQPGPPCRLPAPQPAPPRPMDFNPVLRDTEHEGKMEELLAEVEKQRAEINQLKQQLQDQKVAFSASLSAKGEGTVGPFPAAATLVFKRVVTNAGNAYNTDTGVFTAPVGGVYHFEWHIGQRGDPSHASGVVLVKNSDHIFVACEKNPSHFGSSSNSANLHLQAKDTVFLRLLKDASVFDGQSHSTTFSGHLLFLV